ncbi:CAP domain-containing protein [uncultured Clostridium sp.]|uniref:CAP domain-containing protein n=1 Tax=uncultured Clostridium sp. TaxID=59620 RepID=UPI002629D2A0|nr:CAP domain-containing protein [uncultured Clostridium sp.]
MIKTKILMLLISVTTLIGGLSIFHKEKQTLPNQSLTPQVESDSLKNTDTGSNTNSNTDSNTDSKNESNSNINSNSKTNPPTNTTDNSASKTIVKADTKSDSKSKNADSSPTNDTKNTAPRQEESSSKKEPTQDTTLATPQEPAKTPVSEEKTAPKKAPSSVTETTSQTDITAQIQQLIFSKVNQERANAGIKPLAYSTSMQSFAIKKSKDMAVNNYFNHEDLNGNLESTYIKQAGINFSAWGENIAYVDSTSNAESIANTIMSNWMNSPGHKANILSTRYTQIGVGVYKIGNKYYATQEFLTP